MQILKLGEMKHQVRYMYIHFDIQGVQEKMCFFIIHCNPILAYIAVRDKALNAMQVYSHSYWLVIFCTANSSRVLTRERWQTFENSWKKDNF